VRQVSRYNKPVVTDEGFSCCADALFAVGGEGDVGGACVPPIEGPFCFAVADDEDAWVGHCECEEDVMGAKEDLIVY
jgi:hypothetical protein